MQLKCSLHFWIGEGQGFCLQTVNLVGLNRKHKSTSGKNVIVFQHSSMQMLVLINYQKCSLVVFIILLSTHSWFLSNKALLSAAVGYSLQR